MTGRILMMPIAVVVVLIAIASTSPSAQRRADGRDLALTPGATNPAVTQATLRSTVCIPGWTATVRPPTSYTNDLKARQIAQYGYADTDPGHYEEDHLIPLALGGAPRDPANLWPEPRSGPTSAGDKDVLEASLHRRLCAGQISLVDAQHAILAGW